MHLKSLTLKGFKSFPDRTRLEFDPGVSVVVGPNGSGKSNVTDAVLWALGEQRPLAIRGGTMQDVIFGGGRGVSARSAAEVELVLDNADGSVDLPVGEISIVRRLDRSGDGEYRLNGARCRLTDVQEVLSDTGLGKEAHSVVSQGRVEAIVTSKPKDRRLLIEEAAGLGKHRRRRRRAQLKLDRTRENLDAALVVEQQARKQLGPLKRQAEAAELHERLERQTVEARWELVRDAVRERRAALADARAAGVAAREERDGLQGRLDGVVSARREAEEELAEQATRRDRLASRVRRATGAADRIELRLERIVERRQALAERIARRREELERLEAEEAADRPDDEGRERVAAIEAELVALDAERQAALERELVGLDAARVAAEGAVAEARRAGERAADRTGEADRRVAAVRGRRREREQAVEAARREAAAVGAQLAAANQFLRVHAGPAPSSGGGSALSDGLRVQDGAELAVSAALDGRLGALVAADPEAARALLEGARRDGARVLVAEAGPGGAPGGAPGAWGDAPVDGARPLLPLVDGEPVALAVARRLLDDAWLVDALPDTVPFAFVGTLVTPDGLAWRVGAGELSRTPQGGAERVLAERNRRDRLVADSERAVRAEQGAAAALEALGTEGREADAERERAELAARDARRAVADAEEALRDATRAVTRRREAPDEGASAVRRAELNGELAAERRAAAGRERARVDRDRRTTDLAGRIAVDEALLPAGERLADILRRALTVVRDRAAAFERAVAEDRASGGDVSERLRASARDEAGLAAALRAVGDRLTAAEVAAGRAADQEAEATRELGDLAERLGLPAEPTDDPLDPDAAEELRARIAKLQRRREQLGPVNPLAGEAYEEARAEVEELETQRTDLETALRELEAFVRDTDREIRRTFEATFSACARNFEELSAHVFPGGGGRLRLVREAGEEEGAEDGEPADEGADAAAEDHDAVGVEIEITPAGKATKRLSLLSGGEKSMTAIAFLFSVFLARPCPFYVLDEVEAALDDLNIDRFLQLLRRYRDRAQFIVVTHQKRTMEVADALYGVSMGGDGVSKVVSRRLPRDAGDPDGVSALPGLPSRADPAAG